MFTFLRLANAIVNALQHGDDDVERVARNMLRYGLVEGPFKKNSIRSDAVASLINLLQSENDSEVINAAWVLGDICEESAIKPLQNIISDNKIVKDFVTQALDQIHSGELNIEGEI